MTTTKTKINGKDIWISVNPITEELPNGFLQDSENQYICFYSFTEPTGISYGAIFKDYNDNNKIFESAENAYSYAKKTLSDEIYPERFEHPLDYNLDNVSEIMNKSLIVDLGIWGEDEVKETILGKVVGVNLTNVGEINISSLKIEKENGITKFYSIMEILAFRKP